MGAQKSIGNKAQRKEDLHQKKMAKKCRLTNSNKQKKTITVEEEQETEESRNQDEDEDDVVCFEEEAKTNASEIRNTESKS